MRALENNPPLRFERKLNEMVKFLLDTDTCIYIIKKRPEWLFSRFQSFRPGEIGISTITLAELRFGIAKSQFPEKNNFALETTLRPIEVLPFDENAAFVYGEIRSILEKAGTPIGSMDCLIAAHSLSIDATIVTNNEREFCRVPSLKIQNWEKK